MILHDSVIELSGAFWYCARTQPKHEHIAAAGVARKLDLEVFHPRLRIEKATRRGVVRFVEPLFPCYIFVRCETRHLKPSVTCLASAAWFISEKRFPRAG